ncbi:MAG: hypothetical protein LC808_07915, partial [Actinobacteria bacterium]|nr:hypothetical protein [Actinomycetota bacterium]
PRSEALLRLVPRVASARAAVRPAPLGGRAGAGDRRAADDGAFTRIALEHRKGPTPSSCLARLLNIPFGAQTWDASLAQYHPGLNTTEYFAVPKSSRTRLLGGWQHELNESEPLRARLRDMCSAHPDSPLWSVVDRSRIDARLRRGRYSISKYATH